MESKKNSKLQPKKQIALNVPMDEEFMKRIAVSSHKMHVGKAAYARMAIEEKMQKDTKLN